MKRTNVIMLLIALFVNNIYVYAAENDLSKLKSEELSLLKDEISEVIEKYHTPKSEIKDEVLNTVKNDVESYAKEKI